VTAPAGNVGNVPVTLDTVESDATGAPAAQTSFTYTKAPAQTLIVHRSGSGKGKITSSPKGISCPKTCSHKFAFGTLVTLKAKASRGSAFAGWQGAVGCSKKSRCKVDVNAVLAVTAKFTRRRKR
jgi:hypothetical protein